MGSGTVVFTVVTSNVAAVRMVTGSNPETGVFFGPSEYGELTKDSAVNCDWVMEKPFEELQTIISKGRAKLCDPLPDHLLEKIVAGAKASKTLSSRQKNML